jgi:two-component system alkaline phosphatase synthesis response regulator PhoP
MYHGYMPKKILFVEDDDSFFYTFSIPLTAKGYNVVRVSEGFQAVEKVLVEKPDLIFLDIVLPGVNGLDILKELKEKDETKNIKIVMLTNFGTEDNVKKAMELGADDYFSKYNVVPSELPEKVATLLGETPEEGGVKVVS